MQLGGDAREHLRLDGEQYAAGARHGLRGAGNGGVTGVAERGPAGRVWLRDRQARGRCARGDQSVADGAAHHAAADDDEAIDG